MKKTSKKNVAKPARPVAKASAAKKPVAKKVVAKKPAVKKTAAKKPAAKRTAVAKKPVAKQVLAKKVVSKKAAVTTKKTVEKKSVVVQPDPVKKPVVHRGITIVTKKIQIQRPVQVTSPQEAAKAIAFARSIAEEMKQAQLKQAAQDRRRAAKEKAPVLEARPTRRSARSVHQFNKTDLAQFRKVLIEMRERITGRSSAMRNTALEQNDERNLEEDGTDAFMRLQALGQVCSQNQTVAQIDQALHAIDKGTYGVCEVCGSLIRKQRLEHLPFAKTCIECQSAMENPYARGR